MKFPVRYVFFSLCMGLLLLSGWNLYRIYSEYRQGEESYAALSDQFVAVPSKEESSPPDFHQTPPGESVPAETAPKETAPITVDFDALQDTCADVVGWIYCADTPIHYPVVQAGDNLYYLDRLMDGTWNSSGSIFMDYRCTGDFSDWNTVLYGHNMKNASMFGSLQEYKEQAYYDLHPVWYLLTPDQDYRIDLIGGYTTSGHTINTNGFPQTQAECDEWITTARKQSTFQSGTEVQDGERIITLSTCAYDFDDARYALVGVLRAIGEVQK